MNKIKYILASILTLALLQLAQPAFAQERSYSNSCGAITVSADVILSETNPQQFDVMACIRGFSTEETLRSSNLSANFICAAKSSGDGGTLGGCETFGFQTGQTMISTSFNSTSSLVGFENGSYFTCFRGQNLNRDIGQMDVNFSYQGTSCKVTGINTVPSNYNIQERAESGFEAITSGTGTNNTGQYANDLYCADGGINTAIGCISTDAEGGFIIQIIQIATGLGGAIALLLMLFGFFVITTSAGMPDKVKSGQEIITGAISGLLFIIFSVILLQIIGVQILAIPGLTQ